MRINGPGPLEIVSLVYTARRDKGVSGDQCARVRAKTRASIGRLVYLAREQRSLDHHLLLHAIIGLVLGETKVDHTNMRVGVQENVFGFDV